MIKSYDVQISSHLQRLNESKVQMESPALVESYFKGLGIQVSAKIVEGDIVVRKVLQD